MIAERAAALPRWDLSDVFPGPNSPEFDRAYADIRAQRAAIAAFCVERGVDPNGAATIDDATVATFERIVADLNALLEKWRTLVTYLSLLTAVDSRHATAQARLSETQLEGVELSNLQTRIAAWLGRSDSDQLVAKSAVARDYAFFLQRVAIRAQHLLSPAEEALAAEMSVSGGSAWARLHGNLTSQLQVSVTVGGQTRALPMSEARTLADDPDRATRQAGFEAEIATWQANALPLASALNGVKGQTSVLNRRRGWSDDLEPALFDNNLDRATLDAMHSAVRASFPDFRRYMRAKARALGISRLMWFDLFAPLVDASKPTRTWTWTEANQFIQRQFRGYSDKMADLAARAEAEGWIDAEPRFGKRDGAFCSGLRGVESRIMQNWAATFDGVGTLAHELGHAYHNLCLDGRLPLQRGYPMTLAETASTFCETIIETAYLDELTGIERRNFLDQRLRGLNQVVVDIHSRFLFESWVFAQRRQRELSVDEFCDLMRQAQRETYGDGLVEDSLHAYMWAVKSHYYSPGRSFYNYPYTFGALFGLGLYARYQQDPGSFRVEYDRFLHDAGMADCATLAARFGVDIRQEAFWANGLAMISAQIDEFEHLINQPGT